MCFRIYVHYYFHLFVWFFFSFYFITTCSWYFSYNIVNKMFDFFLLRLIIEMIEKRFLVEHRKLDLNGIVFPPSFLDWPCLFFPHFICLWHFLPIIQKIQPQLTPLQMHLLRKKKFLFFFLLLCFQHQTLKLKASLAQLYTLR